MMVAGTAHALMVALGIILCVEGFLMASLDYPPVTGNNTMANLVSIIERWKGVGMEVDLVVGLILDLMADLLMVDLLTLETTDKRAHYLI